MVSIQVNSDSSRRKVSTRLLARTICRLQNVPISKQKIWLRLDYSRDLRRRMRSRKANNRVTVSGRGTRRQIKRLNHSWLKILTPVTTIIRVSRSLIHWPRLGWEMCCKETSRRVLRTWTTNKHKVTMVSTGKVSIYLSTWPRLQMLNSSWTVIRQTINSMQESNRNRVKI